MCNRHMKWKAFLRRGNHVFSAPFGVCKLLKGAQVRGYKPAGPASHLRALALVVTCSLMACWGRQASAGARTSLLAAGHRAASAMWSWKPVCTLFPPCCCAPASCPARRYIMEGFPARLGALAKRVPEGGTGSSPVRTHIWPQEESAVIAWHNLHIQVR